MHRTTAAAFATIVIINLSIHAQTREVDGDAQRIAREFAGKTFNQLRRKFHSSKTPVYDKSFSSLIIESNIRQGDLQVAGGDEEIRRVREIVGPVLKLYARESIEIVIFKSRAPNAVCIGGTALFYSTGMLKLASDKELEAITAHELAHEYFNGLALAAREKSDFRTLRSVELMCDAFAVAALRDLDVDTLNYKSILTKLTNDGLAVAWKGDGSDTHPRLETRLVTIDRLSFPVSSRAAR